MAISLRDLRREVGYDLNELYVGTVFSATNTTITDVNLLDSIEMSNRFASGWVYLLYADGSTATRRIVAGGYMPQTGTLTLSSRIVPPSAGDEFEIHLAAPPETINRCINLALQRLYYRDEALIPVSADAVEYGLDDYVQQVSLPQQIYEVDWLEQEGDRPTPLYDWYVEQNRGDYQNVLYIGPSSVQDSGYYLVRYVRPYDPLQSETETTNAPTPWVKTAAMVEVYDWLSRNAPAQDTARYEAKREQERLRLLALSATYAPRVPSMKVRPVPLARRY